VCVDCLFFRSPSRAPYGTPSAYTKRAAFPDPSPVVPDPESLAAQAAYTEALLPGSVPARIVSRHWGPPRACYFKFGATGSHIVNSVTPVTVVAAGSKLTSA
jgi:hypothetical protein